MYNDNIQDFISHIFHTEFDILKDYQAQIKNMNLNESPEECHYIQGEIMEKHAKLGVLHLILSNIENFKIKEGCI